MKRQFTLDPEALTERLTASDRPDAPVGMLTAGIKPRSKRERVRNPLKAFCATLQQVSRKTNRSVHDELRSFVVMAGMAFAVSADPSRREERERRYLEEMNERRYPDLETRLLFPKLCAILVDAVCEAHRDFFQEVYVELDLRGNSNLGQIFTPYPLAKLMAALTLGDQAAEIERRGYTTMQEPACGTGVMVIAAAEHLLDKGINYQNHLYVTAIDVDENVALMAYIQMTLYGVAGVVTVGNTLTLKIRDSYPTIMTNLQDWPARRALKQFAALIGEAQAAMHTAAQVAE